MAELSNVLVLVIAGAALNVLLLDERFNRLLDHENTRHKSRFRLVDHFVNQQVVTLLLARLHYTHNGRLEKQLAVLFN